MSHSCPDCGQLCYCDGEDYEQPTPDDCTHWLDGECGGYDDDGEPPPCSHTPEPLPEPPQ